MDTHDIKVHHAEGLEKDIKTSELYSRIFLLESCSQNANEIFPAYIIAVDGSSQCSFTTVNSPNILAEFNATLITAHGRTPTSRPFLPAYAPNTTLPDLELFFEGEHIICARNLSWLVGSICVFLQGEKVPADGVPGFVIKRLVHRLVRHGCKFCGSVPVSDDNSPYTLGILTSNFVTDKGCHGVCEQERGKQFLGHDLGIWAAAAGAKEVAG